MGFLRGRFSRGVESGLRAFGNCIGEKWKIRLGSAEGGGGASLMLDNYLPRVPFHSAADDIGNFRVDVRQNLLP
ncbi:hypothetical protein CEXT_780731 [Caerostris extrusa]|uniref:Uncharacterized protein n=1 Tax=Caerostris extrusa TaxID=172846 RepID=A0AAV4TRD0_CAEEX|nr:hypothetical protein CEXT_780731 [Caerostris extrusa]